MASAERAGWLNPMTRSGNTPLTSRRPPACRLFAADAASVCSFRGVYLILFLPGPLMQAWRPPEKQDG